MEKHCLTRAQLVFFLFLSWAFVRWVVHSNDTVGLHFCVHLTSSLGRTARGVCGGGCGPLTLDVSWWEGVADIVKS